MGDINVYVYCLPVYADQGHTGAVWTGCDLTVRLKPRAIYLPVRSAVSTEGVCTVGR